MRTLRVALLLSGGFLWAQDTCQDCHGALEGDLGRPAAQYGQDVHKQLGFGCATCHGGDPKETDPELSMSRARGFRGAIARAAVPELCASCHSDANLIHQYNPRQRVDQLAQYRTSVHGQRLAKGDTAVANCVDCHSVHDIRRVRHPESPVHPVRLPETCARCHSDPEHMAKYGIPTNQLEEYRRSVHWKALAERGDLSAPSCASCHGNHGATPPQVSSVTAVCGTCHVLMENLFNESPHKPVFAAMEMAGCIACHSNHAVLHPTTDWLTADDGVCYRCHEQDSAGGKAAAEMAGLLAKLRSELDRSEEVLRRARTSGMEVSGALVRQREARENLVKARVAVHAFRVDKVREPVETGLAIAAETYAAGEQALKERDFRRIGLGVSLVFILMTIVGLWLTLRMIERRPEGVSPPVGGSGR